jgi:hypothetical protein
VESTVDGYTLDEAKAALAQWKAAVAGLATSQSYTIGTRTLTRVNLSEARQMVSYFASIVGQLSGRAGGGIPVMRIMPRDL